MSAKRLFEFYGQVSEAPNAVDRLHRFVLNLAVRGKLVVPDTFEGQGVDLKSQIRNSWKELVSAGVLKNAH